MISIVYALARILATCGGVGYFPYAPGTSASVMALFFWYGAFFYSRFYAALLLVLFIVLGLISSHIIAENDQCSDPSYIVIDEWVGMGFALIFVPICWQYYLLSFLLFRLFDITKIFFIKRVEKLSGGWGIMLDDILAGFYTLLIMRFLCHFL